MEGKTINIHIDTLVKVEASELSNLSEIDQKALANKVAESLIQLIKVATK